MLAEEIAKLNREFKKLKGVHDTLALLPALRLDIQKICTSLKSLIESGDLSEMDADLKLALEGIYNIFKASEKGMTQEPIAGLFESLSK